MALFCRPCPEQRIAKPPYIFHPLHKNGARQQIGDTAATPLATHKLLMQKNGFLFPALASSSAVTQKLACRP